MYVYRHLSVFYEPDVMLHTLKPWINSNDRPVYRYTLPVHLVDVSFRQVSVIEFSMNVLLTFR
jgi:hypothetical protein